MVTEAGAVGIYAEQEQDMRKVAEIINELGLVDEFSGP